MIFSRAPQPAPRDVRNAYESFRRFVRAKSLGPGDRVELKRGREVFCEHCGTVVTATDTCQQCSYPVIVRTNMNFELRARMNRLRNLVRARLTRRVENRMEAADDRSPAIPVDAAREAKR